MNKEVIFPENAGLQQLVEVLDFLFAGKDALVQAKENDGKISLRDFPIIVSLFDDADEAYTGVELIPAAWNAATDEERAELVAYFAAQFDIDDDRTERRIEKAVAGLVNLYEAVTAA